MSTIEILDQLETRSLKTTDLQEGTMRGAANVYINAFGLPPYNEQFSESEAEDAIRFILDQGGDLILGEVSGQVVSIAGGYLKEEGIYYIEELAVEPSLQRNGLGRKTLNNLLEVAQARNPIGLELRTTANNQKAINLYRSVGFEVQDRSEIVPQFRQDGCIGLDERIYLFKPLIEGVMAEKTQLKRVAIAYPGGNTTAIVFDQLLGSDRKDLNSQVMNSWKDFRPGYSEVEQCCFITTPNNSDAIARVEMFGGEFCGNATRSVIALITKGRDYNGTIEVSGVNRPLDFSVKNGIVSLEMPLPEEKDKLIQQVSEGTLVKLDGISQLVVTNSDIRNKTTARELLDDLLRRNEYDLADQPAVGVSYYDETTGEAEFCVWVNAVKTTFDETACGSGTCAIGVSIAIAKGMDTELKVIQPSGEIIFTKASVDNATGQVNSSRIAGKVDFLYDGKL